MERKLKETNSFYEKEDTDTRLKYSVAVPDDDKNAMEEFKPKYPFGFQENFRKTLGASEIKKSDSDVKKYIPKHKSKETSNKPKILLELKDSMRLLENYINDADMKIYDTPNQLINDVDVKIYIPQKRIKK